MSRIPWLADDNLDFPPVDMALSDPDGLLAAGGDLSPARLIAAYRLGIFPWYEEGQPILWWSPAPRFVLFPHRIHISRSLRKTLKRNRFTVTADTAFPQVIDACSAGRLGQHGTWITDDMKAAYRTLFDLGMVHSIETWQDGRLVGGLYGVALNRGFFGESMFFRASDASKVALVALAGQLQQWGYGFIDCQVRTEHLLSLGAESVSRADFNNLLQRYVQGATDPPSSGHWQL